MRECTEAQRYQTLCEAVEDEWDLPQPRFSIAIDDDAANPNDFQDPPPRLLMASEDDIQAGRSVEVARRAIGDQPPGRMSRGSFGGIRESDRFSTVSGLAAIETSQQLFGGTEQPASKDKSAESGHFDQQKDIGLVFRSPLPRLGAANWW